MKFRKAQSLLLLRSPKWLIKSSTAQFDSYRDGGLEAYRFALGF